MAATKSNVSYSKIFASWLDTFVGAVVRLPKEIVIDDIPVLVLGTVKAFTEFQSVESYLNICHLLLSMNGEEQIIELSRELPKSFK